MRESWEQFLNEGRELRKQAQAESNPLLREKMLEMADKLYGVSSDLVKKQYLNIHGKENEVLDNPEIEPFALVMKGGGAKGLAYLGAIQVLTNYYQFNWFVGTSAGAIAAVLLAAGYTVEELKPILKDKKLTDFMDARFYQLLPNLFLRKGFFPAIAFNNWLEKLLNEKVAPGSGTPVRLEQLKHRCTVYAARRGTSFLDFDSKQPETKIKEATLAVRSSISIPFVFQPQSGNGKRVFDGGIGHNYPLIAFLNKYNERNNLRFLGLYLGSRVYKHTPSSRFILSDLLSYWLSGNDEQALKDYSEQTIIIDPSPISTLRFNLSDDEKAFLLASGRLSALEFIFRQSEIKSKPSKADIDQAKKQVQELSVKVWKAYNIRKWKRYGSFVLILVMIWGIYQFLL